MAERPLIACGTYRKTIHQDPPIDTYSLMLSYTDAIVAAGGIPVLIPLGLADDDVQSLLERVDGVLLPGGGDVNPAKYGGNLEDPTVRDIDDLRDETEFLLISHALRREKPFFAICRGIQIVNVALGGSLWEDVASGRPGGIDHDHYRSKPRTYLAHDVNVEPDSTLARALGSETVSVNSLHHQGIRDLASGLRAVATAPDGLIEGVEVPDHPFAVAVQWHPENLVRHDPAMLSLFRSFVKASASRNGSRENGGAAG